MKTVKMLMVILFLGGGIAKAMTTQQLIDCGNQCAKQSGAYNGDPCYTACVNDFKS